MLTSYGRYCEQRGGKVEIKLQDDARFPDIRKALADFENQIPKALAQTITFTAERVQRDLVDAMQSAFDRPTRFTLNSVRKTTATPTKLYAQVFLKDEVSQGTPAAKYLQPQIQGGSRRHKGVERNLRNRGFITNSQYMVPGDDAPLNTFGNLTGGQVTKALSNIQAHWDSSQNTASPAARKRQKRSGRQYFWMPEAGIFWRQGKSGLRSFMVVAGKPSYRKRFDFYGVSERSAAKHLPEQMQRSIDRVLRQSTGA